MAGSGTISIPGPAAVWYRKQIELVHEKLEFTYWAGGRGNWYVPYIDHDRLTGMEFAGKVVSTQAALCDGSAVMSGSSARMELTASGLVRIEAEKIHAYTPQEINMFRSGPIVSKKAGISSFELSAARGDAHSA